MLGAGKEEIEALGAEFVALHKRLVTQAEFGADFGGAFVIAEKDDLDVRMEELPGLQGVALDDGGVIAERFRGGEKREHDDEDRVARGPNSGASCALS